MNDVGARLALVAAVVAVSGAVIFLLRSRSTTSRSVSADGFKPGVYFLTSSACSDCEPVRQVLIDRLGSGGFTEYSWESDRQILESLRVDTVPSTMIVDQSGKGIIWLGAPAAMFSVVDP